MRQIKVKVHPSSANLKKEDQLAWKIAEVASDKSRVGADSIDMIINRSYCFI
jgi:2-methylcitrate dehydratase